MIEKICSNCMYWMPDDTKIGMLSSKGIIGICCNEEIIFYYKDIKTVCYSKDCSYYEENNIVNRAEFFFEKEMEKRLNEKYGYNLCFSRFPLRIRED